MELPIETNPNPVTMEPEVSTTENEETTEIELDPDNPDNEATAAEPELEEVDRNGKKYKVPKELIPELMFQADYTKKTQEVAEQRKEIAAQREAFQREVQINQELARDTAKLINVETELQQYQNVNWPEWQASNPQAAQAGMARMLQLQNEHRQTYGHVEARKAEIAATHDKQFETVVSQAIDALSKPDPSNGWDGNFSDAKRESLTQFALKAGISERQVANTTDPASIKILNLAMIGHKYLEQSRKATAKPPAVEAKPVPQVSTGKSQTVIKGLDDRLSTEEWVKRRNEQERRLNAR